MTFWVGLALWQKLSFVLAGLLTLVLVYAFAVLAYSRCAVKRHAAADQDADQDAEEHPILENLIDIPFGARALEKGVQVEGIWTSKDHQPTSHSPKAAAGNVQRPLQTHQARKTSQTMPELQRSSCVMGNTGPTRERLENVNPASFFPMGQPPEQDIGQNGPSQNQTLVDRRSGLFRSSWISHLSGNAKKHRMSKEHSRTRSELFRHQMGLLFDDNVQMRPHEAFQLNEIKYEPIEDIVEQSAQGRNHVR